MPNMPKAHRRHLTAVRSVLSSTRATDTVPALFGVQGSHTASNRGILVLARVLAGAVALLLALLAGSIHPTVSAPGINENLNFNARVTTSGGEALPDGDYNLRFKVYCGGDGIPDSKVNGDCTHATDEDQLWSEDYTGGNRVAVRNGYISVRLGSVTSFGDLVDWNQDELYVSINIGGASGTPDWDGEMDPMFRITSNPQAFNAKHLGGLTSDQYVQLGQGVQEDSGSDTSIAVDQTGGGELLDLRVNGTSALFAGNNGRMGIGTDDPSWKLHVTNSDWGQVGIGATAPDGTAELGFYTRNAADTADVVPLQILSSESRGGQLWSFGVGTLFLSQNRVAVNLGGKPGTTSADFTVRGLNANSQPAMRVYTDNPGMVVAVMRGAASQIADLQQWQDSDNNPVMRVTADGTLKVYGALFNYGTQTALQGGLYFTDDIDGDAPFPGGGGSSPFGINLKGVGEDYGITFGTDTNLYRSAANTLKTDGGLEVASYINTNTIQTIGVGSNIIAGADLWAWDGAIAIGDVGPNGELAIRMGGDTNLYRSDANTLMTDGSLVVNRAAASDNALTVQIEGEAHPRINITADGKIALKGDSENYAPETFIYAKPNTGSSYGDGLVIESTSNGSGQVLDVNWNPGGNDVRNLLRLNSASMELGQGSIYFDFNNGEIATSFFGGTLGNSSTGYTSYITPGAGGASVRAALNYSDLQGATTWTVNATVIEGRTGSAMRINTGDTDTGDVLSVLKGSGSDDFRIDSTMKLLWGSGSSAVDTNLYRTDVATLRTDNNFQVGDTLKVATASVPTLAGVKLFTTIAEATTSLRVGTGSNGVEFSASAAPTYRGSARPTKRIRLTAEYSGAVLDADGTDNTGTMTSGFDSTSGQKMNYYKWTTTQVSAQDYDVVVQVPVPTDFSAWAASNPIGVRVYNSTTAAGTVQVEITDSNHTTPGTMTDITHSAANTWATKNPSVLSGTFTPGDYFTIRLRLTSPTSGDIRIGNITLDYLAGF